MELYAGSLKDFVSDTLQNQIASKLENAFFEYFGHHPSESEVRSWRSSLRAVKDIFEPSEGFTIKVLDKNDKILYSEVFIADLIPIREAPDYFFDDSGEQVAFEDTESPKEIKETSIVLTIPYFEEAEKIQIYDPNNKLVLKFLIDEEFNKTGFDLNSLKTIIGVLIILILIGIIIYKRKVIVEKIKKISRKEEKE